MVDESFVPSDQRTSVLYFWLTDVKKLQYRNGSGSISLQNTIVSHLTAEEIWVFLRPLPKIHTFHQYLEDLHWFDANFKKFGPAVFDAIEVKGRSMLNFEVKVKSKKIFQILMEGMNFRERSPKNQMSLAVRSDKLSCRIFVPIFW